MTIPAPHLAALRIGRFASGPAFVHGVADIVIDGDDDGGITGDPPDGLHAQEPVALELARQGRHFVRSPVDQGPERSVGHHEVGTRPTCVR